MSVRQFKLINANGLEWNLMRKDAYFSEPSGLGFSINGEYMVIGSNYQPISMLSTQKVPSGTMVFETYNLYRQFADFINATPLRLAYKPETDWYYLDCEVTSFEKGEIDNSVNRLLCPITFTAEGLWYKPTIARRTSDDVDNPKKYDYEYDYQYADEINGYIRINNQSAKESPCVVSIMGNIENPTWTLSVNNEQVASGSVNITIPSGHKLVVDSRDGKLEVAEYVASTDEYVRNLYQYIDFDRETFIQIPSGNSVMFISGETVGSIEAWVEVEEIHETI